MAGRRSARVSGSTTRGSVPAESSSTQTALPPGSAVCVSHAGQKTAPLPPARNGRNLNHGDASALRAGAVQSVAGMSQRLVRISRQVPGLGSSATAMSEHTPAESADCEPGPLIYELHDTPESTSTATTTRFDVEPLVPEIGLRIGDLVVVDRDDVNCRAWMSITAPVRRKLGKGTTATLLSDPFPYGQHSWSKLRLHDDNSEGCVATCFLDLIERPAAMSIPSIEPFGRVMPLQPADSVITITRLKLRSGPGVDFPVIRLLERGVVGAVLGEQVSDGSLDWLPAHFAEHSGWVAARHTGLFSRAGKSIEVDLSAQSLSAWDGRENTGPLPVSSGRPGFSTPIGAFAITQKTPVGRLQAMVRGDKWDLPGVPWIMVFDQGGFDIHAAYWHNDFGKPRSRGCVTLSPDNAEWLYDWTPLGTPVWIHA